MWALYGNVDLLNRPSIPGLVIEDNRIRLARSGGVMNAIRDYIPVSQQTLVLAAPRVNTATQTRLPTVTSAGVQGGIDTLVTTPVVSAINIGPTGKVFKMFSLADVRAMQLVTSASGVGASLGAVISDALPAPTPQFELFEQTAQTDGSVQTEKGTAIEAASKIPAFLRRGEIIVIEGGIATPVITLVNRSTPSPAGPIARGSDDGTPVNSGVNSQDERDAERDEVSIKKPLALID